MSRFNEDYIDTLETDRGTRYLVYRWLPAYKRYVNTHMFNEDQKELAEPFVRKPRKQADNVVSTKVWKKKHNNSGGKN